jgi:hypothetical protein
LQLDPRYHMEAGVLLVLCNSILTLFPVAGSTGD